MVAFACQYAQNWQGHQIFKAGAVGKVVNSFCLQLVQKIEGRKTPEEDGDGHCDKVLAIAAHLTLKYIASAGLNDDCEIKLWEDSS